MTIVVDIGHRRLGPLVGRLNEPHCMQRSDLSESAKLQLCRSFPCASLREKKAHCLPVRAVTRRE